MLEGSIISPKASGHSRSTADHGAERWMTNSAPCVDLGFFFFKIRPYQVEHPWIVANKSLSALTVLLATRGSQRTSMLDARLSKASGNGDSTEDHDAERWMTNSAPVLT